MDRVYFLLIAIFALCTLSYRAPVTNRRDLLLLRLAMALTVAADFCMLILYKNLPGLYLFCAVQLVYNIRYADRKRAVALFVMLAALFAVLSAFGILIIYRMSCLYAICLLSSVTAAVSAFRKKKYPFPNNYLVLGGMILFLLCDICVMLYNLTLPAGVLGVFQRFIWVFYLPSQLLLSLSARDYS